MYQSTPTASQTLSKLLGVVDPGPLSIADTLWEERENGNSATFSRSNARAQMDSFRIKHSER